MVEVPPPYLEPIDHMSPDPLDLIPTSMTCSPPFLSLMHEILRPFDYFVSNDVHDDLGHMDHLLNMPKGNALDVILY